MGYKAENNKVNIFDAITNINQGKEEAWEELKEVYNPYMVNKILSMNNETIFAADETNQMRVPAELQYLFLFHIVPKKRRWSKYIKPKKDKLVDDIAKFYKVCREEARLYLKSLTPDQIKEIQEIQSYTS